MKISQEDIQERFVARELARLYRPLRRALLATARKGIPLNRRLRPVWERLVNRASQSEYADWMVNGEGRFSGW